MTKHLTRAKYLFLSTIYVMIQLTGATNLPHLTYVTSEEVPRGTRVGNIAEDVVKILNMPPTSIKRTSVNLMITNWQDVGPRHFTIDTTTGYLIVTLKPDRESLCTDSARVLQSRFIYHPENSGATSLSMREKIHGPQAVDTPCTVTLRVVYTPDPSDGYSNDPLLLAISIIITDINDNVPTFPQTRMNLVFGELSALPEETFVSLPTARDPDAGVNGTLSYWLEHGTHLQRLNSTVFPFRLEGLPDGNALRLRLVHPLDYEQVKAYEFFLCVIDNGKPNPLSSRLRIHVDILDENDNIPAFEKSSYFIIINESLPRGSILLDLHAVDRDSDQNGQVSIELQSPMTDETKTLQKYFDVRTVTPGYARLFLRQTPDLDVGSDKQLGPPTPGLNLRRSRDFNLLVVATDNGSPRRLHSEATVTVRVLDVNDMVPKITVNHITQQSPEWSEALFYGAPSAQRVHGVIMENVERGLIAFVTVQDLDSGPWGQVTCKTDNEAFKLVFIGGNSVKDDAFEQNHEEEPRLANEELSFKLIAQKAFDREETPQVTFRIVCIDSVFRSDQTQTFVQDLSPPANTISHLDDKPFTIVTDRTKQLTGTAHVSVRILDENDCPPEFSQPVYSFSEEENVPDVVMQPSTKIEGKAVGIIQATDRDLNPVLTYTLQSNPQDAFRLDSKTGVLYIVRLFDREAYLTSVYEGIEVRQHPTTNESTVVAHIGASVSDGKHTAETQIEVTITDVNDCPPVFEETNYEFFVEENHRPTNGHPIGTVKAHDSDAGLNGKIVYRLQQKMNEAVSTNESHFLRDYNPIRHFKIDPVSGTIYALRPLDREQHSHHVFHVIAVDASGSPVYRKIVSGTTTNQFTATTTVTVTVNDVNDNPPSITFPALHTKIKVEAGTPAGQQIFTVTATDPDVAENGTVRYFLHQSTLQGTESRVSSNGHNGGMFSIDEQTGIVLLADTLFNQPTKYLLTIGAHDMGCRVQQNTSVSVVIHVIPKNHLEIIPRSGIPPTTPLSDRSDARKPRPDRGSFSNYPQSEASEQTHHVLQETESDSRRFEDAPNAPPQSAPSFVFLTDRIIIFVLSSIFVILLVVTVVLIFLIRRRRFIDVRSNRKPKDGMKAAQIQNNIENSGIPYGRNNFNSTGSTAHIKPVVYPACITSDGSPYGETERRSNLSQTPYPMHPEDSYTLLEPVNSTHIVQVSSSEMDYKSHNPCVPLNSFASLVPISTSPSSHESTRNRAAIVYSASDTYAPGCSHFYPVCTVTRVSGQHQNETSCHPTLAGPAQLITTLVAPTRKYAADKFNHGDDVQSNYNEMPVQMTSSSPVGNGEYQMLLHRKMPILLQHRQSGPEGTHGFPISGVSWTTLSQNDKNQKFLSNKNSRIHKGNKEAFKSATLQPTVRSSTADWPLDLENSETLTTASLNSQKVVKFSDSSLSLNALPNSGDGLLKTVEPSYV